MMGWPVTHSASPRLHGFWIERYDVNGAYVPLTVAPQDLVRCVRVLPRLGFAGVNVTLPHKEAAVAAVDSLSVVARRIGAINTIIVGDDGRLRGDNSDAFGFIENLKAQALHWRATDGPALVIGAGGAARAVCVALIDAGVTAVREIGRASCRERA